MDFKNEMGAGLLLGASLIAVGCGSATEDRSTPEQPSDVGELTLALAMPPSGLTCIQVVV